MSRHATSRDSHLAELGVGPSLYMKKNTYYTEESEAQLGLRTTLLSKRMPSPTADWAWKIPTSPLVS